MNKKAALSLGITTIVYLVIAMIIIGSGIAFVRGVFEMGEDTLGNAMPADDIGLNPTSDNRFVMGSNSITVSRGETTTVQAAVYNTDNVERQFEIHLTEGECVPNIEEAASEGAEKPLLTLESPPASVSPGESTGFRAILSVEQEVKDQTYICSLRATGTNPSDDDPTEDEVTMDRQIDITVTT